MRPVPNVPKRRVRVRTRDVYQLSLYLSTYSTLRDIPLKQYVAGGESAVHQE